MFSCLRSPLRPLHTGRSLALSDHSLAVPQHFPGPGYLQVPPVPLQAKSHPHIRGYFHQDSQDLSNFHEDFRDRQVYYCTTEQYFQDIFYLCNYNFSDMNKCEYFIDKKLLKKFSKKTKSIIYILGLVFLQFLIIFILVLIRLVSSTTRQ